MKLLILLFLVFFNFLFGQVKYHEKLYLDLNGEFKEDFKLWGVYAGKEDSMIRFTNNDLLYSRGSFELKDSFKIILQDFMPRYVTILKKYENIIDNVVIAGHTSSENNSGSNEEERFEKNMILSQKRADRVLDFIKSLNLNETDLNWINNKFLSEGMSHSELILNDEGKEDKKLSRRIEFIILFNQNYAKIYPKNDFNKTADNTTEETFKSKFFYEVPRLIREKNENDLKISRRLSLKKYINELLVKNPTLNEQYFLLKSLEQDIESAKASFRPTVSLNYSITDFTNSSQDQTGSVSKDITIRYNLFNGFKDESQIKINEYDYLTKNFAKEQLENDLLYSLIESYLNLKKSNDVYELSRENYGDYINWQEKSKIKFQNGLLSLRDYSKIEARAINRYINFEEDTKRFNDSITTIQKYIDFSDEDLTYLETPQPSSKYFNDLNLALEECKIYSPFIKEAEQNIALYKEKLEQAKVNFYPTVDLIGKKSSLDEKYKTNTDVTDDTTVALQASLELYSGGKDKANEQKKFFEYKQKMEKRKEVEKDIVYKVDMAINGYNTLSMKDKFFEELVTKREEEFIAANYDFKFAKINENDLLDIMDSLYNAKRQYTENKYDLISSKYKILKEIGVLKSYFISDDSINN